MQNLPILKTIPEFFQINLTLNNFNTLSFQQLLFLLQTKSESVQKTLCVYNAMAGDNRSIRVVMQRLTNRLKTLTVQLTRNLTIRSNLPFRNPLAQRIDFIIKGLHTKPQSSA